MHSLRPRILFVVLLVLATQTASAQLAPEIAYMYPAGGMAGQTVDVVLGGYNWTPDMQVFVHDPRIKLEIVGPPGPVIVAEPPYWFGKKARRGPFPMPREVPARLTIPADVPAGVVTWQAANANGGTAAGRFVVGAELEVVEEPDRRQPQQLSQLPLTVNGQIRKIAEVDRYQFTAAAAGVMNCLVTGRPLGLDLNALVEVRDAAGDLIASAADTAGTDLAFSFAVTAGATYTVSITDVDFRGDRAFVYRLTLRPGPRVVAAVPAVGRRGETRPVEFIGYGVATGGNALESATRDVSFPADAAIGEFAYQLETPHGKAAPFALAVSDLPQYVEPAATAVDQRVLGVPCGITGVLDERYGEDRYLFPAKKGEAWEIVARGTTAGAPLDVVLAIQSQEGMELVRSDDMPGSVDASLQWTAPDDGNYRLVVADVSGTSGTRAAVYHVDVQSAVPDFTLAAPEFVAANIGGKVVLKLTATRRFGFNEAIKVSVAGLPEGVTVPAELAIPEKQAALNVELTVAADAPASAALASIAGEATAGEKTVRQTTGPVLVVATIKPPFSVDAEGKDDVTKWPRGTIFPGPVLIEREEGFNGEIVLEMTAKQGRHVQGIRGPEIIVPPGAARVLYPIFLPEWLETTRTSRMELNGVAQVADPRGTVRHSLVRLKTRIGFLPTGALLTARADVDLLNVKPGEPFAVPVTLSRSQTLKGPAVLELVGEMPGTEDPRVTDPLNPFVEGQVAAGGTAFQTGQKPAGLLTAEAVTLSADQPAGELTIAPPADGTMRGEWLVTIRATVIQAGTYPVISETRVIVNFGP